MTQKTEEKPTLLDEFSGSRDHPMIFTQMAKVIADVGAIGKNQKNQHQGFNFRGIDDLYNACHDAFARHHIFSTQEVLEHQVTEGTTSRGAVNFHHRVKLAIRFHTLDASSVETILYGEAMDTQDKGMNKAYSIAMKYALIQALMIPVADLEDPDRHTTELAPRESQKPSQGATRKPAARQTTSQAENQTPAAQVNDADLDPTQIICHVGKFNGTRLDKVPANYLWYLAEKWNGRGTQQDQILKAAATKLHKENLAQKAAKNEATSSRPDPNTGEAEPEPEFKGLTHAEKVNSAPSESAEDDFNDDDIPF